MQEHAGSQAQTRRCGRSRYGVHLAAGRRSSTVLQHGCGDSAELDLNEDSANSSLRSSDSPTSTGRASCVSTSPSASSLPCLAVHQREQLDAPQPHAQGTFPGLTKMAGNLLRLQLPRGIQGPGEGCVRR
jgi:hypothetical protein